MCAKSFIEEGFAQLMAGPTYLQASLFPIQGGADFRLGSATAIGQV